MLRVSTPFPQVGSYGLINDGAGRRRRVRVQRNNDDGTVLVIGQKNGESTTMTVPLADLVDATTAAHA